MESKQEQQDQLKRLVDHPGWQIFKELRSRQQARRQQVKARNLRSSDPGDLSKASFIQGKIDGVNELFEELDRKMKDLKDGPVPKESDIPQY